MYVDHFGLTERPFQLTPDARYWFESATHRKAMAYLGYGLDQGEGFIVITGEIGAGKSTLIAHLLGSLDETCVNAVSIASTQVDGDDMLRLAAQALGVAVTGPGKAASLDAIEKHLILAARAGRQTVLIVDEAQNLPLATLEELRMLSNFQSGGRALIQIVLSGQPEFRDHLAEPGLEQLRQRVIATHHLAPMEASEIAPYIRHRLAVAGWSGGALFADDAFDAIHAQTGGIPRKVNQLANRLLLHAAIAGAQAIDAAAVALVGADLEADQPAAADPVADKAVPHFTLVPQPDAVRETKSDGQSDLTYHRMAMLEARVEEQEQALRRVLGLLVDWVENDAMPADRRDRAA